MLNVIAKTDTYAAVALTGRLDSQTAPALQEQLEHLVRSGRKFLVLDFAAVTLLASSGLRLLLLLETACREQQGGLAFAAVPGPVLLVLEIAGFAPHFARFPDVAAARVALGA